MEKLLHRKRNTSDKLSVKAFAGIDWDHIHRENEVTHIAVDTHWAMGTWLRGKSKGLSNHNPQVSLRNLSKVLESVGATR